MSLKILQRSVLCLIVLAGMLNAQGNLFLPVITITDGTRQLEQTPQLPQQNIPIAATVSNVEPSSAISVRLFYRVFGGNFEIVFMQQFGDSLWTGAIPSYDVVAPYVDYYVRVDDGLGYATTLPPPVRSLSCIPIP